MRLEDFDYELPLDLIARFPLAERSQSRLLCIDGHRRFKDVIDLINPGDLLIFNDTKVIPARLLGRKTTGGQVEILVERLLNNNQLLAMVKVSKPPHPGDILLFANDIHLQVIGRQDAFYILELKDQHRSLLDVIEEIGQIPLPPYMHRAPNENDKERYQTVYAKHKGSAAAPTAGLHFDEKLLTQLRDKQVNLGYLTLHIGAGTFSPVRVDNITEHKMHAEHVLITPELCQQIADTKAQGKRVIAVGTTSLRALESACQEGVVKPYAGDTQIFIYPGHTFHSVDALITNLHLPKSTLLMLVCAFGGYEAVMKAYREAVSQSYRFYSYGDAMWLTKA